MSTQTAAAYDIYDEAVAQEGAGNLDLALISYRKALALAPADTRLAYRAASALLQAGQLEEAQSHLRRIVFAEPDNHQARASLANCQYLLGDTDPARSNFQIVLERLPDHRNALYGLCSLLLKDGKLADASGVARKLAGLMPDNPAALTLLARTQDGLRQTAAATASYRKALKVDPDHVPAMLGLARSLLLSKRFDEVLALGLRAAEKSVRDPEPYQLLGLALEGQGAFADALEASAEAARLAPGDPQILVRMSILARKLEDFSAALAHALAAHDAAPADRGALNALGAAMAALNYPREARAILTLKPGGTLDPDVRQRAERLVADTRRKAAPPERTLAPGDATPDFTTPDDATPGDATPDDATSGDGSSCEHLAAGTGTGECSPEQDAGPLPSRQADAPAETAGNGARPTGPFSLSDDDPLPNVLGLRRRDKND